MCIIIEKKPEHHLDDRILNDFMKSNQDGWGVMTRKPDGHVQVMRGTDMSAFRKCYRRLDDKECYIHFRRKTHGAVDKQNCHPYHVAQQIYLMHNGVLARVEQRDKTKSDTWHFAKEIIAPLLEQAKDPHELIRTPSFRFIMENVIGGANRVVLYDSLGGVVFNESLWTTLPISKMRVSNTHAWSGDERLIPAEEGYLPANDDECKWDIDEKEHLKWVLENGTWFLCEWSYVKKGFTPKREFDPAKDTMNGDTGRPVLVVKSYSPTPIGFHGRERSYGTSTIWISGFEFEYPISIPETEKMRVVRYKDTKYRGVKNEFIYAFQMPKDVSISRDMCQDFLDHRGASWVNFYMSIKWVKWDSTPDIYTRIAGNLAYAYTLNKAVEMLNYFMPNDLWTVEKAKSRILLFARSIVICFGNAETKERGRRGEFDALISEAIADEYVHAVKPADKSTEDDLNGEAPPWGEEDLPDSVEKEYHHGLFGM